VELRNRDGDLFTNVERVNNAYQMVLSVLPPKAGSVAWTHTSEGADPTHKELVEHLQQAALVRWQKEVMEGRHS